MAPTDRFEMRAGNDRTAGRVRSGISLIGRLYAAAPPDISGAEVSWRTFPWFLPLWVESALPLLALGNGVASDVIIVLGCPSSAERVQRTLATAHRSARQSLGA
jgi:hypothetical protein